MRKQKLRRTMLKDIQMTGMAASAHAGRKPQQPPWSAESHPIVMAS
jgi:hypothetical protein